MMLSSNSVENKTGQNGNTFTLSSFVGKTGQMSNQFLIDLKAINSFIEHLEIF